MRLSLLWYRIFTQRALILIKSAQFGNFDFKHFGARAGVGKILRSPIIWKTQERLAERSIGIWRRHNRYLKLGGALQGLQCTSRRLSVRHADQFSFLYRNLIDEPVSKF